MPDLAATNTSTYRPVRAPRGLVLSCKSWQQEAALRMLMNSLDPDVAERPDELVVCGACGKIARDWESFHALVAALTNLENDATLLVESGEIKATFAADAPSPRVVITNPIAAGLSNRREDSERRDKPSLLMRAAAPSRGWTSVGTQTALPVGYQAFAAIAREHFQGNLAGKLIVSGGMGALGGAQSLAATLNGAAFLGIDADPERIKRRVKSGYCDVMVNDLDEALRILKNAVRRGEATSVGLAANCADVIPALARRGVVPDILTDQTSGYDPAGGYIPSGLSVAQAAQLLKSDAEEYRQRSRASISAQVDAMLALQKLGAFTFDGGNNIFAVAHEQGVAHAFDIRRYESLNPSWCQGRELFRWVALSGAPADIHRIDQLALEMFPADQSLVHWLELARKRVRFQGLPARVCWMDHREQARFGMAVNDLVARGELKAPAVLAVDIWNTGLAAPVAEGETFPSESRAFFRGSLVESFPSADRSASWISFDGVATESNGHARHTGLALVADGAKEMFDRIQHAFSGELAERT